MKKITKIFVFIALCSLTFFCFAQTFFTKTIVRADSSAKAMCVVESSSSRVLYSKNENVKLPMASTTKIVTTLTVLNHCNNLDEEFVVDDRAVGITGTSIYLKHGEKKTVRELLYGMMLPSGNDAATALALHISNDIDSFCKLMKSTAEKCGAYNSNFENPHGLDSSGHFTTAYDLAIITATALDNDVFREIVCTKNYKISGSSEGTFRYLKNKNKLLSSLEGCIGVKTGYTGNAGRCLVSACERNGLRAVCVVLNCGPMFEECHMLLNKSFDEYKLMTLLPKYKIARRVAVNNGRQDSVKTFTKRGFDYPLSKDELDRVVYKYDLPNSLTAPVVKEQEVGKLEIFLDNCLLFSEKIYTIDSVKKIGVLSSIKDILTDW